MTSSDNEELIKRIVRLARENQALEEQLKDLEKHIEKLTDENERLNALHKIAKEKLSPDETTGEPRPLKFNMATVLFSGIRHRSESIDPIDSVSLLDELDEIFFEFSKITGRLKIEKIRTIGDTYMCAGGIPEKNITNPVDVVTAAFEMVNLLDKFEATRRGSGKRIWELKTGIHTGPVIASVTGKKKQAYDIKGDTVNNTSRIEAVAPVNSILISVMTFELVKEFFDCEYFGKLPVKYLGDLQLYKVKSIKPEFSAGGMGKEPNELFKIKFGLIQFTDIQEVILDKLEKELPRFLHYHNVKHTVDVVTEVELIGWAEGCTDEEILLLKTAALFHDAGHTVSYDDHEMHGAMLAKEMLPGYNYTDQQIKRICSIIMATKLPPRPSGLLEEIICDSDLDYLGRSDFIPVSNSLFEELKAQNKMADLNEWNKMQVKFISGHQYFTKTARSLREVNKQLQIERIQSLISD